MNTHYCSDALIDMYARLFNCDVSMSKSFDHKNIISLKYAVFEEDLNNPLLLGKWMMENTPFGIKFKGSLKAQIRKEVLQEVKDKMLLTQTGIEG